MDKRLVLLHYGEEMRKQRAAFHTLLQPRGEKYASERLVQSRLTSSTALSSYEIAQDRESLRPPS